MLVLIRLNLLAAKCGNLGRPGTVLKDCRVIVRTQIASIALNLLASSFEPKPLLPSYSIRGPLQGIRIDESIR